MLDDGSCSGRLFVGERLDYLAGPRLRAVQDLRCLVGQGEGELVAIGGSRGVVGLELGGFALEGGVQGRELRDGFLGQGEVLRVNLDADSRSCACRQANLIFPCRLLGASFEQRI